MSASPIILPPFTLLLAWARTPQRCAPSASPSATPAGRRSSTRSPTDRGENLTGRNFVNYQHGMAEKKKSKYDTNPLDGEYARRADDEWGATRRVEPKPEEKEVW